MLQQTTVSSQMIEAVQPIKLNATTDYELADDLRHHKLVVSGKSTQLPTVTACGQCAAHRTFLQHTPHRTQAVLPPNNSHLYRNNCRYQHLQFHFVNLTFPFAAYWLVMPHPAVDAVWFGHHSPSSCFSWSSSSAARHHIYRCS